MQDRLMEEIAELGEDTRRQMDERAEAKLAAFDEYELGRDFANNREGRRAAARATRKRNGYTR